MFNRKKNNGKLFPMRIIAIAVIAAIVLYIIIRRRSNSSVPSTDTDKAVSPASTGTISPPKPSRRGIIGRYVRLMRASGSDAINIGGMWVYPDQMSTVHIPITSVTVSPPYDSNSFPNTNLGDGNPNTIVHTKNDPSAFVEMDFGSDQTIWRVKIENRRDCCWDRIKGTVLVVYDSARKEVARIPINTVYKDYQIWFDGIGYGEIDSDASLPN